jgi:hypothetical protein
MKPEQVWLVIMSWKDGDREEHSPLHALSSREEAEEQRSAYEGNAASAETDDRFTIVGPYVLKEHESSFIDGSVV